MYSTALNNISNFVGSAVHETGRLFGKFHGVSATHLLGCCTPRAKRVQIGYESPAAEKVEEALNFRGMATGKLWGKVADYSFLVFNDEINEDEELRWMLTAQRFIQGVFGTATLGGFTAAVGPFIYNLFANNAFPFNAVSLLLGVQNFGESLGLEPINIGGYWNYVGLAMVEAAMVPWSYLHEFAGLSDDPAVNMGVALTVFALGCWGVMFAANLLLYTLYLGEHSEESGEKRD